MLIDPPETVGDWEQFCPTLIALSTRLDDRDLKTFRKGSVTYLAIDPPSQSEVAAIATCVGATVNDGGGITYDEIMKRYEKVGANLSILLTTAEDRYNGHLKKMQNIQSTDLINEEAEVDPLCVPTHYKYFVAPYNDPEFEFNGEDKGGCKFSVQQWMPSSMHGLISLLISYECWQKANTDEDSCNRWKILGCHIYVVEENAIVISTDG